jgi:hypothetical protein
VDIKQIENIVSRASQVLPPLSDWDGVELCTLLPVLSVTLSTKIVVRTESLRTLINILPDLVDYALNGEVLAASRATAASCVFSIVALYQDNTMECIGLALLRNQIFPIIVGCFAAEDKSSDAENPNELLDAMNLAAMIASAASVRSGNSAILADEVARFFVLVACEGAVSAPVLGVTTPLDCIVDNRRQQNIEISTFAATALGSLLSVNGSPFAKQRLAHGILPIVLSSLQMRSSSIASSDIGTLLCVCHIICCVSVKALGQEKLENLALAIVKGLERVLKELISGDESDLSKLEIVDQLISLLLASLVKLYNQSLSSVCEECCNLSIRSHFQQSNPTFTFFYQQIIPHIGTIVPSLLLITLTMDKVENAPPNLLALQFLLTLAHSTDKRVVHFCKAYKSTVLKHLAQALDNPSSQVRRSAVKTANIWSLIQ